MNLRMVSHSLLTHIDIGILVDIGQALPDLVQQGLEVRGLELRGPRQYTVLNWVQKFSRYTDLRLFP